MAAGAISETYIAETADAKSYGSAPQYSPKNEHIKSIGQTGSQRRYGEAHCRDD